MDTEQDATLKASGKAELPKPTGESKLDLVMDDAVSEFSTQRILESMARAEVKKIEEIQ